MNLYKGTFNWYGEVHVFYTRAKSESEARCNLITRLAKSVDRRRGCVMLYFIVPHRWEVEEVSKND